MGSPAALFLVQYLMTIALYRLSLGLGKQAGASRAGFLQEAKMQHLHCQIRDKDHL